MYTFLPTPPPGLLVLLLPNIWKGGYSMVQHSSSLNTAFISTPKSATSALSPFLQFFLPHSQVSLPHSFTCLVPTPKTHFLTYSLLGRLTNHNPRVTTKLPTPKSPPLLLCSCDISPSLRQLSHVCRPLPLTRTCTCSPPHPHLLPTSPAPAPARHPTHPMHLHRTPYTAPPPASR